MENSEIQEILNQINMPDRMRAAITSVSSGKLPVRASSESYAETVKDCIACFNATFSPEMMRHFNLKVYVEKKLLPLLGSKSSLNDRSLKEALSFLSEEEIKRLDSKIESVAEKLNKKIELFIRMNS